jgi:hypothetical protein
MTTHTIRYVDLIGGPDQVYRLGLPDEWLILLELNLLNLLFVLFAVDCTEFQRDFVSSLLAHSFFSTFPKRTVKTHPTLQDFNFSSFFKHLDQ